MAVASQAIASHAVTRSEFAVKKPSDLNFEDAAALPFAYLTAYYCLHHAAHLSPNERVLIHAASGGVGLAAVRLALAAGAEVYATAGTPAKRIRVTRLWGLSSRLIRG